MSDNTYLDWYMEKRKLQQEIEKQCKEICDKTTKDWLKEIGAESSDAELKNRIAELEREVQGYKEENVRLLKQCLALYRAVKKANCELDKIEESCDNNVWFCKLKERTY
jgi:hypothetical protein